ncbi:MAG: FUSC family protein [Acidobacteriaceae bacterium]|nr:FUSC family protein [Acidobacteriaceae bacterium]
MKPFSAHRSQELLREELTPYKGRTAGSLRDMLGMLLAVVLAMTLRTPGIALSGALLLLMQRERPGLTFRVGLEIFIGSALAAAVTLTWVQLTDGSEVARFLGIMTIVFVAAFCMVTSTKPLFWTIFGFYGFVFMAFWDSHRSSDANVQACLYNLASFAIVLTSATVIEYLFGTRHPSKDLKEEFDRRFELLELYFTQLANGQTRGSSSKFEQTHHLLLQYVNGSEFRLHELYDKLRYSFDSQHAPIGVQFRIELMNRILQASSILGFSQQAQTGRVISSEQYQKLAAACRSILNKVSVPSEEMFDSNSSGSNLYLHLKQYSDVEQGILSVPEEEQQEINKAAVPLFHAGALASFDAITYALKLTLSAMTCYILYNAIAWPGILTCVVTVLFTGLSTTGAMKQKQLYRFTGAALGGCLGISAVSLFFPNMDSITSLVVLLAPVCFLSAWVMRSPRIGYVGVQIAFGFFLTALPGFGPATQIAPARDRVIGVALGILVMWVVFDQLWPTRSSDALLKTFERLRQVNLSLQQDVVTSAKLRELRTVVSEELAIVQQLDFAANFEIGRHRSREIVKSRKLIHSIEEEAHLFYQELFRRSIRSTQLTP